MPRHTLYHDALTEDSTEALISGDEAKHALRVKRIRDGDEVGVLNGRGLGGMAIARTRGRDLLLEIREIGMQERVQPQIDVWTATPKGPRSGEMIDALSQVGAFGWSPLATSRANVDPSSARVDRLARVAMEAAKQSARAWLLEIGGAHSFEEALDGAGGGGVVLADASGEAYDATGAEEIRLLIGPEGGWTNDELSAARDAGVRIARFGPHVMRIETAAPTACAIVIDAEQRLRAT